MPKGLAPARQVVVFGDVDADWCIQDHSGKHANPADLHRLAFWVAETRAHPTLGVGLGLEERRDEVSRAPLLDTINRWPWPR